MLIDIGLHCLVNNANERLDESVHLAELLPRFVAAGEVQVGATIAQHTARICQHSRIVRVVVGEQALLGGRLGMVATTESSRATIAVEHVNRRVRHDDVFDESVQALEQDGLLDLLARGQVPQDGGDALLHRLVLGSLEQANQGGYAARVPDLDLVLVVGAAVGQVAEGTARIAMHIGHLAIQHVTQLAHAAEQTRLLLDRVVLVAQMLQIGRRVRLDLVGRVREVLDDLGQGWIAPAAHHTSAANNIRVRFFKIRQKINYSWWRF